MKRSRLLRLGLFQLAAGSTSVIFLGVVNRVMRVELGIDLLVVSILVGGGHYLGALVAIPFGYYSDSHRLAGYRRTAYALGGAFVTAVLLAASPFVAVWLSQHQTLPGFALGFAFFLLEGLSTFVAGTAYLALITDLTTESERGPATGLVWTLLMVGIITTGIGTGVILSRYSFSAFLTLTVVGAAFALLLALAALLGQEPRAASGAPADRPGPGLAASLRVIVRSAQTRWFAAFLLLALFAYFMQDVILEPFGGEVFALDAAHTARFNAYMGTGVILGMLLGGLALIPRFGKPRITALGCWLQGGAFGLLAYASIAHQAHWLSLAITLLGFGAGLFTVGGVALMMDMTSTEQTGLFVGAWTLIQALAKGPASIAGGALQTGLSALGASPAVAYGGVFAAEGLGVLVAVYLLSRVGVAAFRQEVAGFGALAGQAMD